MDSLILMCNTRLHRIKFGSTGDWQFRLYCGPPAYGWYLKLGVWSIKYLRPLVCKFLGHRPVPYSYLIDAGQVCFRCCVPQKVVNEAN